jgi:multidrug efflux pump subunit AcrA (membrane-fusion protein)
LTEADLQVRLAALENAEAQLRKLERQPRPEEVPPSEAQVRVAEANLKSAKDVHDRDREIISRGGAEAISPQDLIAHEAAYRSALAQLDVAKANLALLKAGAFCFRGPLPMWPTTGGSFGRVDIVFETGPGRAQITPHGNQAERQGDQQQACARLPQPAD